MKKVLKTTVLLAALVLLASCSDKEKDNPASPEKIKEAKDNGYVVLENKDGQWQVDNLMQMFELQTSILSKFDDKVTVMSFTEGSVIKQVIENKKDGDLTLEITKNNQKPEKFICQSMSATSGIFSLEGCGDSKQESRGIMNISTFKFNQVQHKFLSNKPGE